VTGGFSFGGLHAVIAGNEISAQIVIAHLSVNLVSNLAEFSGIDTSALDITAQAVPQNFFISCGTDDYRVYWPETYALFHANPGFHEYPGLDHETLMPQVVDIINWLSNFNI
jgi:hypothetical protein